MARISQVEVPDNKRVEISLTYIAGIGNSTAKKIVAAVGLDPLKRVKDLTPEELGKVRDEVATYTVEGDLRREKKTAIETLKEIGSYRGKRHRRGQPVRGQRTNRNCRNSKAAGRRKTVANKKK